jgi:hypothetical protein
MAGQTGQTGSLRAAVRQPVGSAAEPLLTPTRQQATYRKITGPVTPKSEVHGTPTKYRGTQVGDHGTRKGGR